ncbi:MAG: hypothetical protein Q4F10_02340 [Corynebacterium glutamicum]|nr:hypothetical protein [Corynebacterium glutamicum]
MIKDEWISEDRLKPYLNRVWDSKNSALSLYGIDRRLSASLFQDISFIEVALRNSMSRYLSITYGEDWYGQIKIGFDRRVRENIIESWESLPSNFTSDGVSRGEKLGGRLVASSMFRTWTNMLDKGAQSGLAAPFEKADHDEIWDSEALLFVFPGAQILARRQDPEFEHKGLTRGWVYKKVFPVRQIRNRIAHHESLAPSGVPITGTDIRLDPHSCYQACLDLAGMLDRDLRAFIDGLSTPSVLKELDDFLNSLQE